MRGANKSSELDGPELLEAAIEEPLFREELSGLSSTSGPPPHRKDRDRTGVPFFAYLRRKMWAVITANVVMCTALASWLVMSTPLHRSQAIIFVDGANVVHRIEGAAFVQEYSPGLLRVLHLTTSSAMFDHLSEKFGLPAHFGASDGEDIDAVHRVLDARITATIVDRNAIRVEVKDEDAVLAAAMGNEIFARLRTWLEADRRDRLLRSLEVYEVGAERAEERISEKFRSLRSSLDSLLEVRSGARAGQVAGPVELVQELASAISGYAPAVERQALTSVMLEQELGPAILLAKRAVPDRPVDPLPRLVVWCLITALVTTTLAIAAIYGWWAKREELVRDWHSLFHRGTGPGAS